MQNLCTSLADTRNLSNTIGTVTNKSLTNNKSNTVKNNNLDNLDNFFLLTINDMKSEVEKENESEKEEVMRSYSGTVDLNCIIFNKNNLNILEKLIDTINKQKLSYVQTGRYKLRCSKNDINFSNLNKFKIILNINKYMITNLIISILLIKNLYL